MNELITYICCWLVKHGGKVYQAKQPIELTAEQAKPLLATGAICECEQSEQSTDGNDDDDEALKLAKVVTAIPSLEKDNKEHFTQSGKPQAGALTELVGFEVSAKLRDAAWESFQGSQG